MGVIRLRAGGCYSANGTHRSHFAKSHICISRYRLFHVGTGPKIIRHRTYLIFVIFFTQTRFLENKIYTEERVNYDKRISRQNSVNRDLLDQANNKDQDHEKKGNYTLCVKAVYHWMGVKTTYSVKITHIV